MTAKPLLQTLANEVLEHPPIWLMRQAGRYLQEYREVRKQTKDFLSFCYSPDKASEVTLQPIRRFGFDAAIIFSDILVIPDALGMDVRFVENEGPRLEPLLLENKDLDKLRYSAKHLSPVYEAIRLTKTALPKKTTLIGFAGAAWTLATYMLEGKSSKEHQETRKMIYQNQEQFEELIAILIEAISVHLIAQIEAGAEVLQIFDSWSGSLTEEEFVKYSISPTREIIAKVKSKYPQVPIIGFPRKAGRMYPSYANETGIDALGFDFSISPKWIRENISIPVQGNLDPLILAVDKEKALHQARELKECFKGRPYIFNLGHGILPYTPVSHVEALVETVRSTRG
jgi:uroporphyrinogen decarboxylase